MNKKTNIIVKVIYYRQFAQNLTWQLSFKNQKLIALSHRHTHSTQ